jgi:hypothetical protein
MDVVTNIAVASGLAWASGLRLYAVLFLAGILGYSDYLELPEGLRVLEHPWVLAASGFMFLAEFVADKIPAFDSAWDAIHTFIRIPAGALLAALSLAGQYDTPMVVAAAILGGTLAAGTHAAKAGTRALINTSPEPASNIVASLSEEALLVGGLFAAFHHPAIFLVLLAVFVVLLIWLLPKLWRGLRALYLRLTGRAPALSARR